MAAMPSGSEAVIAAAPHALIGVRTCTISDQEIGRNLCRVGARILRICLSQFV
jgi:hypothetical protein